VLQDGCTGTGHCYRTDILRQGTAVGTSQDGCTEAGHCCRAPVRASVLKQGKETGTRSLANLVIYYARAMNFHTKTVDDPTDTLNTVKLGLFEIVGTFFTSPNHQKWE